jgi:hypothetical protein
LDPRPVKHISRFAVALDPAAAIAIAAKGVYVIDLAQQANRLVSAPIRPTHLLADFLDLDLSRGSPGGGLGQSNAKHVFMLSVLLQDLFGRWRLMSAADTAEPIRPTVPIRIHQVLEAAARADLGSLWGHYTFSTSPMVALGEGTPTSRLDAAYAPL